MLRPVYQAPEIVLPLPEQGEGAALVLRRPTDDDLADLPVDLKLTLAMQGTQEAREPAPLPPAAGGIAQRALQEAMDRETRSRVVAALTDEAKEQAVRRAVEIRNAVAQVLCRCVIAQLDGDTRLPLRLVLTQEEQSASDEMSSAENPERVWVAAVNPLGLWGVLRDALCEVTPFRP